MQEPTTCPQCQDTDETFSAFQNDENSAREAPGKRCDGCGFAVYNYSGDWAY